MRIRAREFVIGRNYLVFNWKNEELRCRKVSELISDQF